MQSLSDCEDAMTTTMEDCLAQLVKNCLLPKHAKIRKTCQDALDLLQDVVVASAAEPHQLRERCLAALQLALESKHNRLETIAINGMQVLLMDRRFESSLEAEREEHWLPTQILQAVVAMPTLSDDQQVDIMKMLLNMTFSSSWCVNARVITKMAEHCIDTFQRTSASSHNHLLVIFVRILDRFLQRSCDESSKMVLETSNVCSAGSVHVAAKATLTQLLTAVAEKLHYKPNTMLDSADCVISEFTGSAVPTDPDSLTSDVVTILAYLCDKLSVTLSNSSSNKQIIPLLLEGIYAVLSNVPVGIRDNHNFVDLIWQQLCPSLICILGNPLTDKSITSQKAALLQDEVGRGSGCSGACPQLGATARTIYTISVELVRLVGVVQSLRPVLESLFHRMLLYPPASHRLDALKTLTELFNSADRLIDLAGPVVIDTDCSTSSRKKAHSNLALLKLIIDSLEECSHCADSAICVATVVLVCDLLTTVEHLVKGDSVEKIEEIQRINRIIEDVDTAPGTTLSSPPGWYASSSDTDSDADVKHDIAVRQTVTQVSEARDSCAVPVSLPLKTDFDLIERQSASQYVQHLLIFLPSLLDCVSQSDVDHMMQKFSSDVCAALMTESQPASASVPLNADGVYLATYSALSLNLKLHLQGYYNSEEKSVPITEMQFIDEILGTGLLLYLSRSWLSEVFHHIISSDLLALAGYTAAMTGHSDSPLIHSLIDLDGLQSHEVAGQMLSVYHDTSIMRSADSGTPALNIGPSFAKEILTVCWDGILDILSSVLTERSSGDLSSSLSLMLNAREETEKARQAICLSLEGLQKAARLTSILGLQDRCGAVFARLASTSCVSEDCKERSDKKRPGLPSVLVSKPSPVRLPAAYALSMDVLLDIGLEMGSHSADCWTHVFKCCAHVASVEHTYFSGQSPTPGAVPESHGLDGARVSELGLYGTVMMSPQPVTPIVGVPELIQQSHIDAGWDSSIVAGGVLTPAVTSKVLCRLSQQVDRLFEDAANKLTMKTLISFLYQLCISSHHQLTTYSGGPEGSTGLPTNALHLYRLGDIMLKCAHSSRPLLHLMRAWCEVAPHFVEAACHQDRTISKKAVNCMHEVATALLSGWGEPAYWRFNEALCKPFENLLCLDMCDGDIQDQVICSIGELVEACSTEMRSGWRSVFGALRAVKIEYTVNEEVNEARQHHIANVLDVFDVFLNTDNVAVFSNAAVDCILCLQKYVHGTGECDADDNDDSDSGSDVMEVTAESLCLPALGYLQHCCSILASMWSMPSCPVISDADRIRTTVSPYCVDPDILNFDMSAYRAAFGVMAPPTAPPEWAPHGQAPHSQRNGTTQRGEDRATKNTRWNEDVSPEGSDDGSELGYRVTPLGQLDKPTGVLRVWFLVLEGLTNTVSACTRNYQPQILQTLFELLRSTAELPGAAFALYCVNHLLLPKLQQWLRHGNQITNYWHSGSLANFKQYCGLCTDLVVEFILQFTAMAEEELAVEFMLKQLLDVLVECVAQATESLSRLGCSCIRHCVLSCGPELTEAMWYIAMCGIKSACHVSVYSLQQLMTPFLPNSDNFYGDIGHVKVAVRKDQSEAGCDRLCHLAHQVFLLESQQGGKSPLDKALDENQSYVFLIYPPTESDTGPDNRLTRVSFSSVVVGLISHQLLMQTVATLLLHGTSNTVTCERSVITAAPPTGGQRVDSGAANGSDGVDLIEDVQLPGMLGQLSARCVDMLLGCLWDSYCVTRDFDKRPGLKFLLQKVAHASTAANLYKLTCVSLTVYMHALLEICAHQDGLCIDNIKDMLATASPPACPRARIDTHMHTFVHMLKGGFDEICTAYVDLYLEHEGPSLADILSTQMLVFLQVTHDEVPTLKRDRSLRQRVADTFSKKAQHAGNSDMIQTVTVQEDNSDNTDENTAMIEPHGDTPGGSTDPTVHTKQRTGDRVYSVASTRTIQGLMTEYKKRKKTKSMPTFVRATQSSRCSGLEHPGGFSSNSMSPQIEQEHRNSVMKDSDAQLGAWVELLCSLLQLLEQLADHQFVALLPTAFNCVNQLICHSRDPRLREALAKWMHHIAHIYGFAPHSAPLPTV